MPQLCTITGGAFQTASGTPIALGVLRCRMIQDSQQGTVQVVATRSVELPLDSSGDASGSLWGPQNYEAKVITAEGLVAWTGTLSIPDASSHSLTP
jgi:hypothetical protein